MSKAKFDLGAMLAGVSEPDTGREQIEYISMDLIDDDPNNFYQLTGLEELAANIALCGQQQPLRIRKHPSAEGRYMIVSGHRRRAAVRMLAEDDPEKWKEIACIVEAEAVSPSLQQLRLIYANSNTRTLTPAEVSEQALQVENLLYQLKEEGYEFPGRMRDHVAKAVNASAAKLARLKMIRENLAECWMKLWKKNNLAESTAYALSRLSEETQQMIFDSRKTDSDRRCIGESLIEVYTERFKQIEKLKCKKNKGQPCENCQRKKKKALEIERWTYFHCGSCCGTCSHLASCRHACSKFADEAKKLRAENKEKRQAEKEAQENKEKPTIDYIKGVYARFAEARAAAKISIKEYFDAQDIFCSVNRIEEVEALEAGSAKVSVYTDLPFGYSFQAYTGQRLCAVADALNCSIDFLLGRSEELRPAGGWQAGNPQAYGTYVAYVEVAGAAKALLKELLWDGEEWFLAGQKISDVNVTVKCWMEQPEEIL